jgi:predicted transcriptional regulator
MSSKIEIYLDILKVLERRGPLQIDNIAYEANASSTGVQGSLEFLIKQGLVEERLAGKKDIIYANTSRGNAIIKFFKGLNNTLPAVKEVGEKSYSF